MLHQVQEGKNIYFSHVLKEHPTPILLVNNELTAPNRPTLKLEEHHIIIRVILSG